MAMNFVSGVLLARALGVEGRGALAALVLLPELAGSIGTLGFHEAVTYHAALHKYGRREIVLTAAVLGLALGSVYAVIVILVDPVSIAGQLRASVGIGLLAAVVLSPPAHFLRNALRGVGDFRRLNFAVLLQALIYLGGSCALAYFGSRSLDAGVLVCVLAIVASATYTASAARRWTVPSERLHGGFLPDGIVFGLKVWPGTLSQVATRRLDFAVLALYSLHADLGHYAVATQLSEVTLVWPAAVATVLMPMATKQPVEGRRHVSMWCLHLLAAWGLTTCLFLTLGPLAVTRIFGIAYSPSVPLVWALLPGILALSISNLLGAYLSGVGRPEANTAAAIAGVAIGSTVFVLFIPKFGGMAAALGSSLAYSVQCLVQWMQYRQYRPSPSGAAECGAHSSVGGEARR